MKWYQSLKGKSLLFFSIVSAVYLTIIVVNFAAIKQSRLQKEASDMIALSTDDIVRDLLVKQRRDEQLVLDMALAAEIFPSEDITLKLLETNTGKEIVSGGLWFEPGILEEKTHTSAYFFSRDTNGTFRFIEDYADRTPVPYRQMEFYVLGKHLGEGETFWTKVYKDPVTKVRMVTVVAPIYKDRRFVGVASVDLKLALRKDDIFAPLLHSENYFAIMDRAGAFIIASDNVDAFRRSHPQATVGFSGTESFPEDIDTDLAARLTMESPEISPAEAKAVSREIAHKSRRHSETILQTLRLVDDDPVLGEKAVVALFTFPHTGWKMVIGIPEHVLFADMNQIYRKITLTTVVFALIFILSGYLFIRRTFLRPITSVTRQIERAKTDDGQPVTTGDAGEIGLLVRRFNERSRALREAREHEARNERLLMQQSKMAAMGEMLDAVAHQWKQPLNALSMYNDLLVSDFRDGEVDEKYIENFRRDIQVQIDHMIDTLATFRSFFRPDAKQEFFSLKEVVGDVLLLARDDLLKQTVDVTVEGDDLELFGSPNEFRHLLLNLISNAKDAFVENGIRTRRVTVRIDGRERTLTFCDNAGGIPESVIGDIFKAHVTTKTEGKGTGIGLYMSMQIVRKHHAELSVENRKDGACFTVRFSEESFHRRDLEK